MKLLKLSLVAFALLSFAAACNNADTPQTANTNARPAATATPAPTAAATPDEFAAARSTYSNACVRCHKPDGSGGLFEEPGEKPLKVPSLREGHGAKHTDAEMSKQIQNGGDGMPAFKTRLDPDKINALVRFIRHDLQGRDASAATPASTPAR
ncbi:MAG: Cytochrome oxidase, cbb3-type, subunit [Acidobacteriota bacterium]|jgi:cytochrome c551|nr:Cytochrome oxidase, cbb3-type, subunit [Acidobacteriota bacterium]